MTDTRPRYNISQEDYRRLLDRIFTIFIERGFKTATMDYVASTLGMSKRTLYEIFDDKHHMIHEVLTYIGENHRQFVCEAFANSANIIEATLTIFHHMRQMMKNVCAEFFRDMDSYCSVARGDYDRMSHHRREEMEKMMALGVEQGLFRADINYPLHIHLLEIQLESLKRSEVLLPPSISLSQAIEHISLSFMRSIATPKGMALIDDSLKHYNQAIADNAREQSSHENTDI